MVDIICTIVQWRISAIFSKIKHEKPRIGGIIFIGSRRKLAFIRIQMNRIRGFEKADIMLKHFLYVLIFLRIMFVTACFFIIYHLAKLIIHHSKFISLFEHSISYIIREQRWGFILLYITY